MSKQEHDAKKPAGQPAKRKVFGDDDDSGNASDNTMGNNEPDDEKEQDDNENNDKDDLDDVDDNGKPPACRSPRRRMPWTPSTRSSLKKKMKRA